MKRLFILLSFLFCGFAFADTINLHWKNYDGTTYENSTCTIDGDLNIPTTPPTRYGYTFTGWKVANYIPIEYLESTGTQYIDTGFIPTSNTKIRAKAQRLDLYSGALMGCREGHSYNNITLSYYNNGERLAVADFNNSNYAPYRVLYQYQGASINVLETSKAARTIYAEDGITVLEQSNTICSDVFDATKSIWIFNINGQSQSPFIGKLYSAQIYDNNILVRDFIPVLDMNGTPCIFDKVEEKFYYNQGTGQFIAGPVINE